MKVERWNPDEGHPTESVLRQKLKARGYEVWRYVYSPGTVFPEHQHDVDKIDAVVSGRFRITLGGESVILEAGDAVIVPRGTVHRAMTCHRSQGLAGPR